ncbi:hypothetical protein [Algibacter aquimarinus]|uniref:Uncharacterized protein n=1 Tax=Algibacter aquimarinus TaxID=1136748 RepID=A0ABP9HHH0_9FLAO
MRNIIVPLFILLLASCQKNDSPVENNGPDEDENLFFIEILNEYSLVNQIFQDTGNITIDGIASAEGTITGKFNSTKTDPVISIEPLDLETFPKTITIDFGTGTLCEDGVTRRGIITVESTGLYSEVGSLHTVVFNNFFHDNFKVEGTQYVENFGENDDNQLVYSVVVEDGIVTVTNDIFIRFFQSTFRTWIAGSETPLNIWDDEYLIEGDQLGLSSNGVNFSTFIEEPLHLVVLPREIKSGIIDLEIGSVPNIKINYTNETFTILGKTTSFN